MSSALRIACVPRRRRTHARGTATAVATAAVAWLLRYDISKFMNASDPPGAMPTRPVILHEENNFNSFPRLQQTLDGLAPGASDMKPFWVRLLAHVYPSRARLPRS